MVGRPDETSAQSVFFTPQQTYEDRLRLIGRFLDLGSFHAPTIVEVEGGLLVRAFPGRSRTPQAIEFPYEGFAELLEQALRERGAGDHPHDSLPLAPTGYEDLMRAIGHELDDRLATVIVITECTSYLLVHGLELVERSAQSDYAVFDAVLEAHDVTALLDAAFRRRTAQPPPASGRSVLQSLGLQRRT
jgi:hypothetical protein